VALICEKTQVDYPNDAFLESQSGCDIAEIRDFFKRDSNSRQGLLGLDNSRIIFCLG